MCLAPLGKAVQLSLAKSREALDRIGSYGRQIGHLAEAMEVIIRNLGIIGSAELSQQERDALQVVLGNVATVRQLKSKHPPSP